jgi:hypothetical protein
VVLGFEVGRYDADYGVECWLGIRGEQNGVRVQELGESVCGEYAFGGYVKDAAGEALW